jgi:hypothetical protein
VASSWRRLVARLSGASALSERVAALEQRLALAEGRALNRRWHAIDELAGYLVHAEVPGDYLEFGVWQGRTFGYACQILGPAFPAMRFVALDSFAGLPKPQGLDAEGGYSSGFREGEFACSREQFLANLRQSGADTARVRTVEGFFHETLGPGAARRHGVERVAAAWIDVDLYDSTVPVLEFLTPLLSVGSVLLFDDWTCFRNLPDRGQQRACREWLARHPALALHELFAFGWHGRAFSVGCVGP